MKKLKFNHSAAQKIAGSATFTTWRIYDDKNLQVNDEIEVIDKVEAGNPGSWKVIAIAKIERIVCTRIGSISEYDPKDSADSQINSHTILQHYQNRYGKHINEDSEVKIITCKSRITEDKKTTLHLNEAKLYADGGSRGNPGPSACGYVVLDMDDHVVVKNGIYLGVTTNNQAEYQALKSGLEAVSQLGVTRVHVYMDSLLVVNQMIGVFKVKNRDLWPIHESIVSSVKKFTKVTFSHVPRELNKLADAAVNEALDEATPAP